MGAFWQSIWQSFGESDGEDGSDLNRSFFTSDPANVDAYQRGRLIGLQKRLVTVVDEQRTSFGAAIDNADHDEPIHAVAWRNEDFDQYMNAIDRSMIDWFKLLFSAAKEDRGDGIRDAFGEALRKKPEWFSSMGLRFKNPEGDDWRDSADYWRAKDFERDFQRCTEPVQADLERKLKRLFALLARRNRQIWFSIFLLCLAIVAWQFGYLAEWLARSFDAVSFCIAAVASAVLATVVWMFVQPIGWYRRELRAVAEFGQGSWPQIRESLRRKYSPKPSGLVGESDPASIRTKPARKKRGKS